MSSRYTVETNGDIALTAATAKTVLSYIAGSNAPMRVIEMELGFDGVNTTGEPVTVELCKSTEAGAGTATSHTILQSGGPTRTAQGTAKRNFTAEPTVLTVIKRWLVHPQTGRTWQFPLGREPEQNTGAQALVLRCTAPANVNCQGYMEVEEG
ncbi:hypothetical protein Aple_010560 [Acrocarpospora pleiomorpha]|uniref:Uncharacterized protein n=1 Tax=Acrocarpospora pleiomorpha TaxID=90975 RepID=A0A5M3XEZ6_9ACTN|nr:hypothetical protein [Acrocarpospora pleiomorpha]GES18161.1 hypothetical protein Aple_010560 [Acrocarpospora pleiomorpha]